jgi:thiamine monophosphate synthase
MTGWPRVLAYLDAAVAERDDLGRCLAAAAAVGPELALVVRWPGASTDRLHALAHRAVANATPPGAPVWVTGRVDVALAVHAQAVVRRAGDLPLAAMRTAETAATSGARLRHIAAVHGAPEAERAVADGADALIVGTIWETPSHPGRTAAGPGVLTDCARFGVPVYAIGGVTPARARVARRHGAWGVAAIRALWDNRDIYRAAVALTAAAREQELT